MAWTSPRTWVASETVTAAVMNSAIRDNLLWLASTTGLVQHEAGGVEVNISAVAKGGLVAGTGAGTMALQTVGANGKRLEASSGETTGLIWTSGAVIEVQVFNASGTITTGDGKVYFFIPAALNGYNLTAAHAGVNTVSGAGVITVQIYNVSQTADMLSTRITIDAGEKSSYTAATPPVIDTANDDIATGDELRIDVDTAGAAAQGLYVMLTFQLP